jgi:hypothetical protein
MLCPRCRHSLPDGSAYCSLCAMPLFKDKGQSVFICYSSLDLESADKIAQDLRNEGVRVWIDNWEVQVGDSIHNKIVEGMTRSDYFVPLISPNSIKSKWVNRELRAAFSLELNKKINSSGISCFQPTSLTSPPIDTKLLFRSIDDGYN